jgi:hypothetical protein
MVQDGSIRGYVKRAMAWNKLPNKVIACLDHKLGPTQILGALFVGMQFTSPTGLTQCHESYLCRICGFLDAGIISPLEVKKGILE